MLHFQNDLPSSVLTLNMSVCRCVCVNVSSAFKAVASQSYFMPLCLGVMGVTSKLYILSQKMAQDIEQLYTDVYPHLESCKGEPAWFAQELPLQLSVEFFRYVG